jgi:septal ring factor EnvC (AmiA/AmiB activator)
MPQSSILTPTVKAKVLAEKREELRALRRTVKENQKARDKLGKEINRLLERMEKIMSQNEEIKATEAKTPRVSKNGKTLGRPRLSDEEKERRRLARKAARSATTSVAVPTDLQPLIPNTDGSVS